MRDFSGRFRCVDIGVNFHSERIAAARLREAICSKTVEIGFDRNFRQGDEPNRVFDLLDTEGVSIDRLHKYFRILTETSSHLPAMRVIQSISPWFSTSDPHFKKEFQETQFDQRLWEIYLWAVLRNQGFDVKHCEAPDLIVSDPYHKMAIEATTVAPSMSGTLADHPEPKTSEDVKEFLKEYMPMKFGSPLKSKLDKTDKQGRHYWEREDTKGIPFAIAIADFHKESAEGLPGTMTYTRPALFAYLYGQRIDIEVVEGAIKPTVVKVAEHQFKSKTVPSGFFDLPNSEFVSAIIFSNSGTISKFNRMGVLAGYKPDNHYFFRQGYRFDPTLGAMQGR